MVLEVSNASAPLSEKQIRSTLAEALASADFRDKRVLVVVPDETRSCPLPLLFRSIVEELRPRTRQLTFLVALGTHAVPDEAGLLRPFGLDPQEKQAKYADVTILPHLWEDPATFRHIGTFSAEKIAELTDGLFSLEVRVAVNRLIFEHDITMICGPVFPHEVVGFSGGHKYIFPGIGEKEFINFFHWLGAVITNPKINGTPDTPVRRLVEEAAKFLPVRTYAACVVVKEEAVHGVFCGEVAAAWRRATEVSAGIHIERRPRPFTSVLACMPAMYKDIWLAGKGMYKLEGVVADGGELIIYAPHVTEISYSHGDVLHEVGYHVRDYFLKQWDAFKHHPWGVLAHSTHVRGVGAFENGVEKPRIDVTLATAIPEETCRSVSLGYRDPASIDVAAWQDREAEGVLCVPHAGETLFRLEELPAWARLD
jgi:nickel-dependent lactate racemase